jgi:hypothetical protein
MHEKEKSFCRINQIEQEPALLVSNSGRDIYTISSKSK